MVIGPTLGERFWGIIALVFAIVLSIVAQLIPIIWGRVLLTVFGLVLALHILGRLMDTMIVIDKSTQTVTIRERSFFLASRQHIIPFSDVRGVVIDYEQKESDGGSGGPTSHDAWKVSLDIGGKRSEIDHTTKKADMFYLASEISRFIGTELVDNSAKPESLFRRFFR